MERISRLKTVLSKITTSLQNNLKTFKVKLLVVSKTRPIEQIVDVYNEGQRDFGENYVNEIIEKSEKLPLDIKWHMIGHLQTNKCKKLMAIKNLYAIESVDSVKLAEEIQKQCIKLDREMNIYLQVNISNEPTKSGIPIDQVIDIYEEIVNKCDRVQIIGLMSLGEIGNKEQFNAMYDLKLKICNNYGIDLEDFTLSLGTSDDFEEAIAHGSNEVRIGGYIFDLE